MKDDRLISYNAAIDAMMKLQTEDIEAYGASIPEGFDGDRAATALNALPTVNAVPVKHGRWIYHIDDLFPAESTQECDQCHEEQPLTCGDNFCPNCGARMDGDEHG